MLWGLPRRPSQRFTSFWRWVLDWETGCPFFLSGCSYVFVWTIKWTRNFLRRVCRLAKSLYALLVFVIASLESALVYVIVSIRFSLVCVLPVFFPPFLHAGIPTRFCLWIRDIWLFLHLTCGLQDLLSRIKNCVWLWMFLKHIWQVILHYWSKWKHIFLLIPKSNDIKSTCVLLCWIWGSIGFLIFLGHSIFLNWKYRQIIAHEMFSKLSL